MKFFIFDGDEERFLLDRLKELNRNFDKETRIKFLKSEIRKREKILRKGGEDTGEEKCFFLFIQVFFKHIFDTDIEEGLRKARKKKQLKLTMKIVTYLM